jgi:TetR/AcrR family transcriptional repressor of nem operon
MARPKEFEPNEVLAKAMAVFWEKGYEGTSIRELEQRMGINRLSIYNTFGDKRSLFLAVLNFYYDTYAKQVFGPLYEGQGGLQDVKDLLRRFAQWVTHEREFLGCLMCNSAVEMARNDPEITAQAQRHFAQLEDGIHAALQRARTHGELKDTRNLRARARKLVTILQGVLVRLRLSGDADACRKTVLFALEEVEAW